MLIATLVIVYDKAIVSLLLAHDYFYMQVAEDLAVEMWKLSEAQRVRTHGWSKWVGFNL